MNISTEVNSPLKEEVLKCLYGGRKSKLITVDKKKRAYVNYNCIEITKEKIIFSHHKNRKRIPLVTIDITDANWRPECGDTAILDFEHTSKLRIQIK